MTRPELLNVEMFNAALAIVAQGFAEAGLEPRLAADHPASKRTAELWIYGVIDNREFFARCRFIAANSPELRLQR